MKEETHGPWLGVRDGPSPLEGDPQHAQNAKNYYIVDPGQGGAWVPRPGIALTNGAAPLGVHGQRLPQGIGVWHAPLGDSVIAFVGGGMYSITFLGGGYTASPFQLTPGSVTISPQAPHVYTCNFNGQLIVTDGVNPPWAWNGTTAAYIDFDGTGIQSHSIAVGPPQVYYDQLFFTVSQNAGGPFAGNAGTTLIWSEPNNPALGYIQTVAGFTYADTWTLEQTGTEPITAIAATNDALYYWRQNSIGALYGSPALNFSTTATHDAISLTTGTTTPNCVVVTDREIYFLDQTGRPFYIERGGFLVGMWQDCSATFCAQSALTSRLAATVAADGSSTATPQTAGSATFDPVTKLMYFGIGPAAGPIGTAAGDPTFWVFDTRTHKFYGQWTHTSSAPMSIGVLALATVQAFQSGPAATLVVHLDANGNLYALSTTSLAGLQVLGADQTVYVPGTPTPSLNSYAIETMLEISEMVYDPWVESIADRFQFVTLPFNYCNVLIDYASPRIPTGSYSLAQQVSQPQTSTSLRAEIDVGVNTLARQVRPRIRNAPVVSLAAGPSVNINAVGIAQCKVRAYSVDMNPGSP